MDSGISLTNQALLDLLVEEFIDSNTQIKVRILSNLRPPIVENAKMASSQCLDHLLKSNLLHNTQKWVVAKPQPRFDQSLVCFGFLFKGALSLGPTILLAMRHTSFFCYHTFLFFDKISPTSTTSSTTTPTSSSVYLCHPLEFVELLPLLFLAPYHFSNLDATR